MTQQSVAEHEAALEKARGRIGLDQWHLMAWFVKLANTVLDACSPGDIQNLQEECEVIRRMPLALSPAPVDRKRYLQTGGGMGSASPTLRDLKSIHEAIAQPIKHLAVLTDHVKDGVEFGPVEVRRTIRFRKANKAQQQAGWAPHLISSYADVTGGSWRNEFVLRAAQLLETYVDSIRQCPHCKKVFLQLRRNATYCGPGCYSVAGMRRLRKEQRAQKELKLKHKTQMKGVRR